MTSRRTRLASTAAALGAVLLLGAAGCTGDEDEPTATPTATQTADPTADAIAAAEDALSAYIEAKSQLTADPVNPALDPATVAQDQALSGLNSLVEQYRNNGWRGTGQTIIAMAEPFSIDLQGDLEADPPVSPSIIFNACIDGSQSGAIDSAGNSVVSPDRPDRTAAQITISEIDDEWLASYELSQGEPCEL